MQLLVTHMQLLVTIILYAMVVYSMPISTALISDCVPLLPLQVYTFPLPNPKKLKEIPTDVSKYATVVIYYQGLVDLQNQRAVLWLNIKGFFGFKMQNGFLCHSAL